jgi:hypothetical protein
VHRENLKSAEQCAVLVLSRRDKMGEAVTACVVDLRRTQR